MTFEAALTMLREHPERTAVLSDFDGTLALLVNDPLEARLLEGSVEALTRLTQKYGLVGVVSGRPVSFLAQHLTVSGLWVSGLYGLESMIDGEIVEMEEALPWRSVVGEVVHLTREALPGLIAEDKGLSMTIHFRTAPEREAEVREWVDQVAISSGLLVREAKASMELHPPVLADKGSVIEAKVQAHGGLETVCFLGDDRGDLPAFAALTRLGEDGMRVVRIAVRTPETPDALLSQADLSVDGPQGALTFLEALVLR